jgi:tetratricopeptide (TPR) repeat protein
MHGNSDAFLFYERIGASYSMLGDFEAAIPFLEEALNQEQTDDRLFQLAFTYLQLHEQPKSYCIVTTAACVKSALSIGCIYH